MKAMQAEKPTAFEASVFEWIASAMRDPATRSQLDAARVTEREHTGVGCFSELVLPNDVPRTQRPYGDRGPINGPHFESPAVPHGGSTLLWFENGLVDCLEIYTFHADFPENHDDLGRFELRKGFPQDARWAVDSSS